MPLRIATFSYKPRFENSHKISVRPVMAKYSFLLPLKLKGSKGVENTAGLNPGLTKCISRVGEES